MSKKADVISPPKNSGSHRCLQNFHGLGKLRKNRRVFAATLVTEDMKPGLRQSSRRCHTSARVFLVDLQISRPEAGDHHDFLPPIHHASIPSRPAISHQWYVNSIALCRRLIEVARPTLVRSSPVLLTQQRRWVQTENIPAVEADSIVAAQRKNRPISPHLTIYKPQITWYLSSLHRITGAILSGGTIPHSRSDLLLFFLFEGSTLTCVTGIYVFGATYLASPLLGWHLDVASIAAAFGSLPVAAKVGIKGLIAFPFAFHSINGLRHLTWDTGRGNDLLVIDTENSSLEE